KVADFGLAGHLNDTGTCATTAIQGTPVYMAPEQTTGRSRRIGPRTDVYALGAILYEMLTGKPPFEGATRSDTLLQILTAEPVPPRCLQPRCPRALERICLKCLCKGPRDRYPSAASLAADLKRFLGRHRRRQLLVGLAFGALVLGALGYWFSRSELR